MHSDNDNKGRESLKHQKIQGVNPLEVRKSSAPENISGPTSPKLDPNKQELNKIDEEKGDDKTISHDG